MNKREPSPVETELKFQLQPDDVEETRKRLQLWARPPGLKTREVASTYYDTPDRALRRGGYTLRLRNDGGTWVQTVKFAAAGAFQRLEWETPAASGALKLETLPRAALHGVLARGQAKTLEPVFSVAVQRTSGLVGSDGRLAEVSLDVGQVQAGDTSSELIELEFELKQGDPRSLFEHGRAFAETGPLLLSFTTKSEQGYRLADEAGGKSSKADKNLQLRGFSTAEALQAIGRSCLHQLADNSAILRRERSHEAVHQARVAIRRLRAALSLFKGVLDDPALGQVKDELKWLAGVLGQARDLDVFVHAHAAPPGQVVAEAAPRLIDELVARQEAAHAAVQAGMASSRYRALLLDTTEWLETGAWLTASSCASALRAPVQGFATKALKARLKAVHKRGRHLASLDAHHRHELRIAGKKLRYGLEFFASLPKGDRRKAQERLLKRLKPLQEVLGELNDLATGDVLIDGLASDGHATGDEPGPGPGQVADLARAAADQEAALLVELDGAYRRFLKAGLD